MLYLCRTNEPVSKISSAVLRLHADGGTTLFVTNALCRIFQIRRQSRWAIAPMAWAVRGAGRADDTQSPAQDPKREAHLQFQAGSRVSTSDGCNRVTGSYELKGYRVTFHQIVGTRMAGLKPGGTRASGEISRLMTSSSSELRSKSAGRVRWECPRGHRR
jgi:hypothetical protein